MTAPGPHPLATANPRAERALLAEILRAACYDQALARMAVDDAAAILEPSDFADAACGRLFGELVHRSWEGLPLDPRRVAAALRKQGREGRRLATVMLRIAAGERIATVWARKIARAAARRESEAA